MVTIDNLSTGKEDVIPKDCIFIKGNDYDEKVIEKLVTNRESDIDVIPTIIPNWDHTPRSGMGGTVIIKSSP